MNFDEILSDARSRMKKCVEHFHDETRGLRSGSATPALVENIKVEAYGSPTPLKQVASIAIPEPRSLVIKPYDQSIVKEIEKAIQTSDLGINPQSDGKVVRLTVPEMSEEQREKLVGRLKELAEEGKIALRNLRRESIKKTGDNKLSEDEVAKAKDEIQKVLKTAESEIDELVGTKAKEIMDS